MDLKEQVDGLRLKVTKHSPDCFAIQQVAEAAWDHVWSFSLADDFLAKDGTHRGGGGGSLWLISACDDPECPAELRVELNSLLTVLDRLVEKPE